MADKPHIYVLHSDDEPLRLERQAALAEVEKHLAYIPLSVSDRVLDAGCGSGSMTRILAKSLPEGYATGMDFKEQYLDFARRKASEENIVNINFQEGNVTQLPFEDDSFDVVWSKYVLQFVEEPAKAIAEFKRVTRPGGWVVCGNWDKIMQVNFPVDELLQNDIDKLSSSITVVDFFIGRKLFNWFYQLGFSNISVDIEPDKTITYAGKIHPEQRENIEHQLKVMWPIGAQALGSEQQMQNYYDRLLSYADREDTFSMTPLYFVKGRVP